MAKVKFDTNSRVYLSNDGEGTNNTVFGYGAGGSIDTGDNYNVFIGHNVGSTDMNNAVSNTGVGYAALVSLTQGSNNTILGAESGYALTTGANNTFIGMQAGDALTQGDNNIAIGNAAMGALSTTDGSDKNIAIGNWAMDGVSSLAATENVFIGHNSGGGSWTGTLSQKNVAIGKSAGESINHDNADNNILIGKDAGAGGAAAFTQNIAIGVQALDGTGSAALEGCVVIGYQAGTAIDHTDSNGIVAIGHNAGAAAQSCTNTTLVGYAAGDALTTGDDNTAIGRHALGAEDAGSNSTAVGYQALGSQNNDTGYNTAVGWTAGDGIVAGYANTLIGAESGTTGTNDLTSGIQNVLIGQATSVSASGATNQVVIGRGAAGQADNSVTLGNADVTDVYMGSDSGAKVRCGVIVASQSADTYAAEIYGTAGASSVTFINKASSGTYITWGTGGVAKGTISESGGTVSYGAFTAHHDAELPSPDNDDGYAYGTLVETTEIVYTQEDGVDSERGIVYKVQKSSSAYAKNVLGSYSYKYPTPDYQNLHRIYVLVDGHILCNGEKGNISVGDGICSSSTVGQGMKADKKTMIIGIAQEDVSFSGNESKLVVVQYGLQQFTTW